VTTTLIVQRNKLSCITQPSFFGLGVAFTGNFVALLPPIGNADRVLLGRRGYFGCEDDLQ
jgi:hypothetical protein